MQLRKKIAAVLVSTVVVGSAFAGGADHMAMGNVIVMPAQNWAGYYAGLDIGTAWAKEAYTFADISAGVGGIFQPAAGGSLSQSFSGVIGGAHVGENWQYNAWVWGIETGLDGAHLTHTVQNVFPNGGGTTTTQNTVTMNWLYTLTPHLGYAFSSHWLLSSKLGMAATNLYSKITTDAAIAGQTDDENHYALGLDAGLGLNYMMTQWVFGVGYDYLYFGTTDFGGQSPADTVNYGLKNTLNVVKASIDYKFNS